MSRLCHGYVKTTYGRRDRQANLELILNEIISYIHPKEENKHQDTLQHYDNATLDIKSQKYVNVLAMSGSIFFQRYIK